MVKYTRCQPQLFHAFSGVTAVSAAERIWAILVTYFTKLDKLACHFVCFAERIYFDSLVNAVKQDKNNSMSYPTLTQKSTRHKGSNSPKRRIRSSHQSTSRCNLGVQLYTRHIALTTPPTPWPQKASFFLCFVLSPHQHTPHQQQHHHMTTFQVTHNSLPSNPPEAPYPCTQP